MLRFAPRISMSFNSPLLRGWPWLTHHCPWNSGWSSLADSRYRHWVVANCNEPLTLEGLVRRRGEFPPRVWQGLAIWCGEIWEGHLSQINTSYCGSNHPIFYGSNWFRATPKYPFEGWPETRKEFPGPWWQLSIYLLLVRNVQVSLRISRLLVKVGSNYTTMLFLQE